MEQTKLHGHQHKIWSDLIQPKDLRIDQDTFTKKYGKFIIEPLERGFGQTLGNSLRRVLLSSMMGSAPIAVKFDSVVHEFNTIPGVLEDVTDIILNLKEVRFQQFVSEPVHLRFSKKGPGPFLASDIQLSDKVKIINPNQVIANLDETGIIEGEIILNFGRGYELSESHKSKDLPVGFIAMDSFYSPVRRVNYSVQNTRVGQRTDYDSLSLEVWTYGTMTPQEAVALASKILKEQLQIFITFNEDMSLKEVVEETVETEKLNPIYFRLVDNLELSVRSANCLKNADIRFIGELVTRSEGEMLKTKNFGRKSLNEIKDTLQNMNLFLGMKVAGWPPKNWDRKGPPPGYEEENSVSLGATATATTDVATEFDASSNVGEVPVAETTDSPAATTAKDIENDFDSQNNDPFNSFSTDDDDKGETQ